MPCLEKSAQPPTLSRSVNTGPQGGFPDLSKTPKETAEKRRQGTTPPPPLKNPGGSYVLWEGLISAYRWPLTSAPYQRWGALRAQGRWPHSAEPPGCLQDMMLFPVLSGCLSNQSSACWPGRAGMACGLGRGLPSTACSSRNPGTPLSWLWAAGQLRLDSCLPGHCGP